MTYICCGRYILIKSESCPYDAHYICYNCMSCLISRYLGYLSSAKPEDFAKCIQLMLACRSLPIIPFYLLIQVYLQWHPMIISRVPVLLKYNIYTLVSKSFIGWKKLASYSSVSTSLTQYKLSTCILILLWNPTSCVLQSVITFHSSTSSTEINLSTCIFTMTPYLNCPSVWINKQLTNYVQAWPTSWSEVPLGDLQTPS